jgi:hypothetical protein
MKNIIAKKMKQFKEMKAKNIEYYWLSVAPGLDKLSFIKKAE